ncbi:MAG: aldo/keto reductase [Tepidisphaeraceae bacterium]|jgi:aryl-alcohol dehydrogenase-like predicted oxidoreductase
MRRLTLGKTGLEMSVLGFGCAKLTAHPRNEAIGVLETALANGVTHFDVARLYGLGWAEGILGEFLKGKRDRVTVTTKFGLKPPGGWVKHRRLVYAAKKVLKIFPPVVKLMQKRAHQGVQGGKFTPQDAAQSLETSLRELGTDHVDVLLLHEAELIDLASEPLIRYLEQQIAKGTVKCVGVGSYCAKLPADLGRIPGVYQVVQFDDSAHVRNLERLAGRQGRGLITHTIFGPALPLVNAVRERPAVAREWVAKIGVDLSDAKAINSLLLHYSLGANPDGVVLFSSIRAQHVQANALDAASGSRYDAKQLACFVEFVDAILGPAPRTPA